MAPTRPGWTRKSMAGSPRSSKTPRRTASGGLRRTPAASSQSTPACPERESAGGGARADGADVEPLALHHGIEAVWDVNFGPAASSEPEAPHYDGGGFELTRDADSIRLRGGAVEHIHALMTARSRICGPLVLVHASAGTPVVMRPDMGLAELVASLEG